MYKSATSKLVDREKLQKQLESRTGKVGFTSGVFDLLHIGHAEYLEAAKAVCDLLVVGINSNSSVKSNKGEKRPIVDQKDRALLVASLACVDYVFIFDETNNNKNVEILKPDLYIKAEDYEKHKLSSAKIVESYGGKVQLIPFKSGYSSSKLIEKILSASQPEAFCETTASPQPKPAIFLDRDGTLIEHVEYLHEPSRVKLFADVLAGLKLLAEAGYRLILVTNQPGIGLGYFTKDDFFKVNREMLKAIKSAGLSLDRIYFCPHSDHEGCDCRKPKAGMLRRAGKELNVEFSRSFIIGDSTSDIQAGREVGCRGVLLETGVSGADGRYAGSPDFKAPNFLKAVTWILQQKNVSVDQ